tara:strand:- start:112 stop:786 length:675 start_codon:yes stop_codon:yes gene_type:complete
MGEVAHLIGNGKSSGFYSPAPGLKITCNLPPFEVPNTYTTVMVDFKMMNAIHKGSIQVPGDWVLGARPHKWMEMRNDFYIKYSKQIKEFYLVLPKYAPNYTDFNCGHMATHWVANKLQRKEIHMYGFDSIFEFDTTSMSDTFMASVRDNMNTEKLTTNWRPIWHGIFNEFPNTQFILYHDIGKSQIPLPPNVEVRTSNKGKTAIRKKNDPPKPFSREEIVNSSV